MKAALTAPQKGGCSPINPPPLPLPLALALPVAAAATADPRPGPGQSTTCDHSSVTLHSSHRHVNYLHQTYAGCSLATHIGRLWLEHGCGTALCNLPHQGRYWSCTGRKTSSSGERAEWLATCRGAEGTVLIGWVHKT